MLKLPYLLTELDSKVFESDENHRIWIHGNPYQGLRVSGNRPLDELTVSCFITFPDLTEHDDALSLLTIGRGQPGSPEGDPSFQDPTRLVDEFGGIYLYITYDPTRSLIEVRKNAGNQSPELVGVALHDVTPELVCGRVLELYVEINQDRICVWLHDRFAGGDLLLKAIGPWIQPGSETPQLEQHWGKPSSGHWWVMSGLGQAAPGRKPAVLPTGFGLSNLRVVLASATEEAVGSLLYRGALDHLVADPPTRLAEEDVLKLIEHGRHLRDIATDLERIRLLLPISKSSQ